MRLTAGTLWASLIIVAAPLVGCSKSVAGSAVKAPGSTGTENAAACAKVSSPMAAIDQHASGEPLLRIPQPAGWQRATQLDSQIIRYALVNRDLVANRFAPNATVTLESAPGGTVDEQKVLDQETAGVTNTLGATDLVTTPMTLCGHRAQTVRYTAPPMGRILARKAALLEVVATFTGTTYVATVTVQTTDPDNPTYARDSQTILTGFQMLAPDAK